MSNKEAFMNLKSWLDNLQHCLNNALEHGASYDDICMYECTIAELLKISRWIKEQCLINNRIYFEKEGSEVKNYFKFQNYTGLDFKFLSMKVNVIAENKIIDTFEIAATNWKNGKSAKLYFDNEIKGGNIVSIDADCVDYEISDRKI